MRLSDAIAMGRVTVSELKMANLDGCALGMAANAVGIVRDYVAIKHEWPWLRDDLGSCPFGRCRVSAKAMLVIAHVFDYHVLLLGGMTLDQLIDWVRSIEPAEEEQTDVTGYVVSREPNQMGQQQERSHDTHREIRQSD